MDWKKNCMMPIWHWSVPGWHIAMRAEGDKDRGEHEGKGMHPNLERLTVSFHQVIAGIQLLKRDRVILEGVLVWSEVNWLASRRPSKIIKELTGSGGMLLHTSMAKQEGEIGFLKYKK